MNKNCTSKLKFPFSINIKEKRPAGHHLLHQYLLVLYTSTENIAMLCCNPVIRRKRATLGSPVKGHSRGGGGGTLIFSYIRRLESFLGVQNFEFQNFLGFQKIFFFWV